MIFDIFHARPLASAPIRAWMYVIYVRDVHRPTLMIVSDDSPASFSAMAPPARKLCDDTRFVVYPRVRSPSTVAPHRTSVVMSLSETRVGCFVEWKTMLIRHVGEPVLML